MSRRAAAILLAVLAVAVAALILANRGDLDLKSLALEVAGVLLKQR